jgi:acyl carrier protein
MPEDPTDVDGAIRDALASIAPEADLDLLEPDEGLQDALDLDSMDFLNFLIAVAQATGVEVPESDYALVRTFRGCRDYVAGRLEGR